MSVGWIPGEGTAARSCEVVARVQQGMVELLRPLRRRLTKLCGDDEILALALVSDPHQEKRHAVGVKRRSVVHDFRDLYAVLFGKLPN